MSGPSYIISKETERYMAESYRKSFEERTGWLWLDIRNSNMEIDELLGRLKRRHKRKKTSPTEKEEILFKEIEKTREYRYEETDRNANASYGSITGEMSARRSVCWDLETRLELALGIKPKHIWKKWGGDTGEKYRDEYVNKTNKARTERRKKRAIKEHEKIMDKELRAFAGEMIKIGVFPRSYDEAELEKLRDAARVIHRHMARLDTGRIEDAREASLIGFANAFALSTSGLRVFDDEK
jgi:hypothetical protein